MARACASSPPAIYTSFEVLLVVAKMREQIVLDRDVRDWVLVPLTMSIVLMMLIRQYATQVCNTPAR